MSTPPLLAGASGGEVAPGAIAADERVQRLRGLIEEVESGPGSFAAALDTALSGAPAARSTTAVPRAVDGYYRGSPASSSLAGASEGAGSSYAGVIEEAAAQNGLEPAVLHGLIEQESGFDPNATSSAGALGLTQLMPGTAASLGVSEPLNPSQSIDGGARYLGRLVRQFGGNISDALAAYNAGPGAVEQYGGIPPYAETRQYVTKVLANAEAYRQSNPIGAAGAATHGVLA